MAKNLWAYRGCLLGMAVGDAMGYTVDSKSMSQIREDYGPNGLLGYDLMNGFAEITSYTQLAAFTCNGLLLGITRGQMQGHMAPLVRYVEHAQREWAASQRPWGRPGLTHCWLLQEKEMCRRRCMDTWMLDTLSRSPLGTLEEGVNTFYTPASITAAVGVGLFYDSETMDLQEIRRLGAEAVALTHGSPMAFLPGALLTDLITRCLIKSSVSLEKRIEDALSGFETQFGRQYPQSSKVVSLVRQAIALAKREDMDPIDAMEQLRCETGAQVLAGALYACLTCDGDFDSAMITAVNHSGRSCAVGSIAGAILGAILGAKALPEFYLECLEPAMLLIELADDLVQGCPMEMGSRLFDDDWDRKYLHGGK